jgi:hypothetical protein
MLSTPPHCHFTNLVQATSLSCLDYCSRLLLAVLPPRPLTVYSPHNHQRAPIKLRNQIRMVLGLTSTGWLGHPSLYSPLLFLPPSLFLGCTSGPLHWLFASAWISSYQTPSPFQAFAPVLAMRLS